MIYLLEDESNIRNLVTYTLNSSDLESRGFSNSKEFFSAIAKALPSLILLDIMLPGEDGLSVLKKLKLSSLTKNIPVIMLTAKGSEYDKVIGLDLGADDYLSKPFGIMELVARVKGLLRRSSAPTHQGEYHIGNLFVSVPRHLVTVSDSPINLALKEFDILLLLLKNHGLVLTRDQIMSSVWGYDFDGESRTVDVHIRTLRSKLGSCEDIIEAIRGVGYRIGGKQ